MRHRFRELRSDQLPCSPPGITATRSLKQPPLSHNLFSKSHRHSAALVAGLACYFLTINFNFMKFLKRNLKKTTWILAICAITMVLINLVAFDAKASATGYVAYARNCVGSDGGVYAYWTSCGSGSGSCVATTCPAEPK